MTEKLYLKYGFQPETVTVIGEFTICWNQFELQYCETFAKPQKILNLDFSQLADSLSPLVTTFKSELLLWFKLVNVAVDDDGVKRVMFSINNDGKQYRDGIVKYLSSDSTDINLCLLCIERIRNNLLHGLKDVYRLDEQAALLQSAVNILAKIIMV